MTVVTILLLMAGGTLEARGATPPESEVAPVTPTPPVSVFPLLTLALGKTEAYPGEEIPVTVTVEYPRDLTVRDIRYPRILHPGLMLRETGPPSQGSEERNGSTWTTLKFTYFLSGKKPGTFILGPTTADCSLLLPATGASGFFDAPLPLPRHLSATGEALTIVPFPREGKPEGFSGAIGDFHLAVTVRPHQVMAGDPVTVTSIISGSGSLGTVVCPSITTNNHFRAYPPKARRSEGAIVCEQLLVPADETVRIIPSVSFTFFDSVHDSYRTLRRGPFPLTVTSAVRSEKVSTLSPSSSGSSGTPVAGNPPGYDHRSVIPVLGGLAFFILLALLLRRITGRTVADATDAVRGTRISDTSVPEEYFHEVEARLTEQDPGDFHTAVFRALQQYLGKHCHLPPQGITEAIIETHLCAGGCSVPVMNMVQTLFSDCDRARYGGVQVVREEREALYQRLKDLRQCLETTPDKGTREPFAAVDSSGIIDGKT